MKLSTEIEQKEFKSEYQKSIINIIYTYNYLVGNMNPMFKKYGITRQQYNVLRILRGQHGDPVTINLIKDRMLDKMSDASRIVVRLKKKNLIEKRQNSSDRRAADILISEKGLDLLATMDRAFDNLDNLIDALSKPEAETLNDLLDKLRG